MQLCNCLYNLQTRQINGKIICNSLWYILLNILIMVVQIWNFRNQMLQKGKGGHEITFSIIQTWHNTINQLFSINFKRPVNGHNYIWILLFISMCTNPEHMRVWLPALCGQSYRTREVTFSLLFFITTRCHTFHRKANDWVCQFPEMWTGIEIIRDNLPFQSHEGTIKAL